MRKFINRLLCKNVYWKMVEDMFLDLKIKDGEDARAIAYHLEKQKEQLIEEAISIRASWKRTENKLVWAIVRTIIEKKCVL